MKRQIVYKQYEEEGGIQQKQLLDSKAGLKRDLFCRRCSSNLRVIVIIIIIVVVNIKILILITRSKNADVPQPRS